jgi:hypothetical protein
LGTRIFSKFSSPFLLSYYSFSTSYSFLSFFFYSIIPNFNKSVAKVGKSAASITFNFKSSYTKCKATRIFSKFSLAGDGREVREMEGGGVSGLGICIVRFAKNLK